MIIMAAFLVLQGCFYVIFEFQNVWPYNQDLIVLLQSITSVGIIVSIILTYRPRWAIFSPVPLIVSLVAISIISRSEISYFVLTVESVIALLIFLLSLTMRALDERRG